MPLTKRTRALPPVSLPAFNVSRYGTSSVRPVGMSRDRTRLYGGGTTGNALSQSVDDGATWTTVTTVLGEPVKALVELVDGEALAVTQSMSSSPGSLWRSTGWATSRTGATWTRVLQSLGGYFRAYWGGGHPGMFGDDTVRAGTGSLGIANEYGQQNTSSGDQTGRATRAYVTLDRGVTWTQRLDLTTLFPATINLHCHASCVDPWSDRLWLTFGDSDVSNGQSMALLYSDDAGVTWRQFALPAGLIGKGTLQSTPIQANVDGLFIGSDNAPGVILIAREGYRQYGAPKTALVLAANTGAQMLANAAWQNPGRPDDPTIMSYQSQNTAVKGGVVGQFNRGQVLTELWRDPTLVSSAGVLEVVGPTATGNIVAWVSNGRILTGKIVTEPGVPVNIDVTGDGTNTVFAVPHRLPFTPASVAAWSQNAAGGAFAATADATNVTVTFTTAPAAGLRVMLAARLNTGVAATGLIGSTFGSNI